MLKHSRLYILALFLFTSVFAGSSLLYLHTSEPKPVTATNYLSETNFKTPEPKVIELNADKLWTIINDWRASEGLKPFTKDPRLCDIATDRLKDGLDYHRGFLTRYRDYPYVLSENEGLDTSEESMLDGPEGWLKSPPHAKALRSDWVYSCVATKGNFAVQIFSNFQP
jgi:uncharacterized protein YkwD